MIDSLYASQTKRSVNYFSYFFFQSVCNRTEEGKISENITLKSIELIHGKRTDALNKFQVS